MLAEGRQRAGGGVGETQAESLVGDAVEAVVDESGEPGVGTPGGGVAHRGRLLECDIDAAARGVFDGLLGLVVEVVVRQAVTEMSQGAEMGAGARATQPSDRRAVHAAHDGGQHRVDEGIGKGGCVCVCEREQGGSAEPSKECVRKVNVFAF